MKQGFAEYIWLDGASTQKVRSKGRFVSFEKEPQIEDFPQWSFDGSSTYQATGDNSDLALQPVRFVKDPIRGEGSYLVMCEVMNADGTPHKTNVRAKLRGVLEKGGNDLEAWMGFEQEYTLMQNQRPLGWPEKGYPAPQGPFYCGVGADEVFGRQVVEAHAKHCLAAGLMLYGINAEVMPGQWEFQIGYRGLDTQLENADPLTVCDHLWMARWLLYRTGEEFNVEATLHPKPMRGDWNGAGKHTNISTKAMRDPSQGRAAIDQAIERLSKNHAQHIRNYGEFLSDRLTGHHETSSIDKFSSGVSDRGSSIRIPLETNKKGYGYIEDRRPGANADPYRVAALLVASIAGVPCDL